MTEKELKRMNRATLLQLLIEQMEENEKLQSQLTEARTQLESRRLVCENAGSLAEAAIQINGVFEAAQAAAQQYLENIQRMNEEQEAACRQLESTSMSKAEAIMAQADSYKARAEKEADAYWDNVHEKVQSLLREQSDLMKLLQSAGRNAVDEA